MQEERLSELLKRFLGVRRYVWDLIAVVVLLALAVNLLASVIYAKIGSYPSLGLGMLLVVACFGYLLYARLRENVFSTTINAFFVVKRDSTKLVYVPAYELASEFMAIGEAAFKENPALERQWKTEVGQIFDRNSSTRVNMRVATEIAEYILLESLSTHLTDYFNTPALEQSQLETLERNDIPDVLLSNRILELISRELRDRPWYQPGDDSSSHGTVVALYGPGQRYSHFDLTMPKGSTVRRVGPGCLVISSKLITLELTAIAGTDYGSMEDSFSEYYLNLEKLLAWSIGVTYNIRARLRRRLGLRVVGWRYYSWVESFTEEAESKLDARRFFKRISWDSAEALLRVFLARYPPRRESRDSEPDHAVEANEAQASDDGNA